MKILLNLLLKKILDILAPNLHYSMQQDDCSTSNSWRYDMTGLSPGKTLSPPTVVARQRDDSSKEFPLHPPIYKG